MRAGPDDAPLRRRAMTSTPAVRRIQLRRSSRRPITAAAVQSQQTRFAASPGRIEDPHGAHTAEGRCRSRPSAESTSPRSAAPTNLALLEAASARTIKRSSCGTSSTEVRDGVVQGAISSTSGAPNGLDR